MKIYRRLAAAIAVTMIGSTINIPGLNLHMPLAENIYAAEVATVYYDTAHTAYATVSYNASTGMPTYDFTHMNGMIDWSKISTEGLYPLREVWTKPTEEEFIAKVKNVEGSNYQILYYDEEKYKTISEFLAKNKTDESFALVIKEGTTTVPEISSFNSECQNLKNMKYVYIPESVTVVEGEKAFNGLEALKEVILSSKTVTYRNTDTQSSESSVTYGTSPFSNTPVLEQLVIPPTVTTFSKNISNSGISYWVDTDGSQFVTSTYNCPSLKYKPNLKSLAVGSNVKVPEFFMAETPNLTEVVIPDGIKEIGYRAFYKSGIDEVTIPATCEKIGKMAFAQAEQLQVLNFAGNKSVKLDDYAFARTAIKEVTLPDNQEELGKSAFQECKQLTRVVIPEHCTKIGANAFKGCTNLAEVVIKGADVEIDASAFPKEGSYTIYAAGSVKSNLVADGYTVEDISSFVEEDKIIPTVEVEISYDAEYKKAILNVKGTDNLSLPSQLLYSMDGIKYSATNTFEVERNADYTIYCKDKAGNIGQKVIKVDGIIDTEKPQITNIAVNLAANKLSAELVVSATDNQSETSKLVYSLDGVTYQASNVFSVLKNKTYMVYCKDEAGNVAEKTVVVGTIKDITKPGIATVAIKYTDTQLAAEIEVIASDNQTDAENLLFSINGVNYAKGNKLTITKNGVYKIYCKDEAGLVSEPYELAITQIKDTESPVITQAVVKYPDDNSFSYAEIAVTATDDRTDETQLSYSYDGINYESSKVLKVYENGTYYIRCKDSMGNVSEAYKVVVDKIGRKLGVVVKLESGFVTNYRKGDSDFRPGGTLIITTKDAVTEVPITAEMIKGPSGNNGAVTLGTAGIKTVTITYNEQTTTQDISVKELTSIKIKEGSGVKTTYEVKESLDKTGTLIATYSDGSASETEEVALSAASCTVDLNTTGNKTVAVSYTAGGNTASTTYAISVRDSQKPEISDVAKVHDAGNNKVTLTVTASDNYSATNDLKYAINDGVYQTSNTFEVVTNGNYKITCKDEAGNISEAYSIAVTEITDDPVISNVEVTYDTPTYSYAELTITANDNDTPVEELKYSKDGVNYQTSNVIRVYENGTYMIKCKDKDGNVSGDYKVVIQRIGRENGVVLKENSGFVTEYTKGETSFKAGGTLIVTTDNDVIEVPITEAMISNPSGADAITTLSTVGVKTVTITYDGKTVTQNIVVKDVLLTEDPVITNVVLAYDTPDYNYATLTIDAKDNDTAVSDLKYSKDGVNYQTSNVIKVFENGTYYIKCRDKDGNVSDDYKVEVTELDKLAPEMEFEYSADDLTKVTIKVSDKNLDRLVMPNGDIYYASGAESIEQIFDATAINGIFKAYDKRGNTTEKAFNLKVANIGEAKMFIAEAGMPQAWDNKDAVIKVNVMNDQEEVQLDMPHDVAEQGVAEAGEVKLAFIAVESDTTTSGALQVEGEGKQEEKQPQQPPLDGVDVDLALPDVKYLDKTKKYWAQKMITLSQNTSLEYTISTASGMITETLEVMKIDKEIPTLSVDISNIGKAVNVVYRATDQLSGIKNIYLPNGEVVTIDCEEQALVDGSFSILEEGDFKIVATDYAGNVVEKYFNVSGIKAPEKPESNDKNENNTSTSDKAQNNSSNTVSNEPKVEKEQEVSVQHIILQAVNEKKNPQIKLNKTGSIKIDKDSINQLITSELTLSINRDNVSLCLSPEFMLASILPTSKKAVEIEIKSAKQTLDKELEAYINSKKGFKKINKMSVIGDIQIRSDYKLTQFVEPLTVSIDLKDAKIDEDMRLTLVKYEKQEDGSIQMTKLGGTYNKEEKVFKAQLISPGIYGLLQSEDLLQLDLSTMTNESVVNDQIVQNDVAPFINDGCVMVPLRFIAENLKCQVKWYPLTREAVITSGNKVLNLKADEVIQGEDVMPIIKDDRLFVPMRYVSETLGANVIWTPSTKHVRIVM